MPRLNFTSKNDPACPFCDTKMELKRTDSREIDGDILTDTEIYKCPICGRHFAVFVVNRISFDSYLPSAIELVNEGD